MRKDHFPKRCLPSAAPPTPREDGAEPGAAHVTPSCAERSRARARAHARARAQRARRPRSRRPAPAARRFHSRTGWPLCSRVPAPLKGPQPPQPTVSPRKREETGSAGKSCREWRNLPRTPRERRGRRQSEGRERGGSELGSDASAGSGRGLGGQAPEPA